MKHCDRCIVIDAWQRGVAMERSHLISATVFVESLDLVCFLNSNARRREKEDKSSKSRQNQFCHAVFIAGIQL
jgi:hypothetical protein